MTATSDTTIATEARRSRPSWPLALGLVIGGVLLWIAVHQVDWKAVVAAVTNVSLEWLVLAMLATAAAQVLFAWRWHVVIGRTRGMAFADAFDFLAIGALAGLVLPPRLSDVARAVAAGRYHAISVTGLFGTIVIERLLDVLMLVMIGAAVSALMSTPAAVTAALASLLTIGVLAAVALWMGERGPIGVVLALILRWRGAESRLRSLADRFLAGTSMIRAPSVIGRAAVLTIAGWTCATAFASVMMRAFDVPAPWYGGAFVIVIINLAGILPSPPAGVGVYHYAATVGVSPWLDDPSRAFAFALVSHALSVVVVLCLGTISLARKGLSLRSLRRMAEAEASSTRES